MYVEVTIKIPDCPVQSHTTGANAAEYALHSVDGAMGQPTSIFIYSLVTCLIAVWVLDTCKYLTGIVLRKEKI